MRPDLHQESHHEVTHPHRTPMEHIRDWERDFERAYTDDGERYCVITKGQAPPSEFTARYKKICTICETELDRNNEESCLCEEVERMIIKAPSTHAFHQRSMIAQSYRDILCVADTQVVINDRHRELDENGG